MVPVITDNKHCYTFMLNLYKYTEGNWYYNLNVQFSDSLWAKNTLHLQAQAKMVKKVNLTKKLKV